MKRWFLALALVTLGSVAHAVPTVAEVQAEVQKGNFTQAQSMLHEVVIAKPGSAKAHYLYAEILAHNSKFSEAAREVAEAKRLDPTLKFTAPAKFDAFEQLLQREQRNEAQRASRNTANTANTGNGGNDGTALNSYSKPTQVAQRAPEPASRMPSWVLPVGLAILAVVAWRTYSKRRAAAAYGGMAPMQGMSPGMAPGMAPSTGMARYGAGAPMQAVPYGGYAQNGAPMGNGMMQPQSGGMGGMMGVGLAAAGGVAAGMLAEKYLHGQSSPASAAGHDQNSFTNNGQASGQANLQAPAYDADAQALNDRSIDFGNGNDWDSGAADAGSFDSSGGGGGGDDNW